MKLLIIFLLLVLLLILNSRVKQFEQLIKKFLQRRSYLLPEEMIVDLRRTSGDRGQLIQKLLDLGYERIRSFGLGAKVDLVLFRNKNSQSTSFIDLLTNGEETTLVLAKKKVEQQGGDFSDVTQASIVLFPDQRIQVPLSSRWFKACESRYRRKTQQQQESTPSYNDKGSRDPSGAKNNDVKRPEGSKVIPPKRYCLQIHRTRFQSTVAQPVTFEQGSGAEIRVGLIDSKATFTPFPNFEQPLTVSDPYSGYLAHPDNNFDGMNLNVPEAHGTFMASVIAAHYKGAATLKMQNYAFHDGVSGHLMDLLAAGYSAISEGVQILNLSLGFFDELRNPHIERLFQYAEEQNVLVICSAGNYNSNNDEVEFWPANFSYMDHVLAVAATDVDGNKWNVDADTGTNFGQIAVNLAVNGVDLLGYTSDTDLAKLSGTSCSAAVLTARAAGLKSDTPGMSPSEIKQKLISEINNGTGIFHA